MISPFSNQVFLTLLGVNVILAWGLYPMAVTGQLSIGQAGFMAVGAYASSWANVHLGWPVALSILFGVLLAAAVAVPVAVGSNRVRGIYLIIGTLAVGEVIRVTLTTMNSLGGVGGYFGMEAVSPRQVWLTCAAVLAALFVLMRSRLGIAMRSIREDEEAAASAGVATRQLKIGAVVFGAAITGLAGTLFAHYLSVIKPEDFDVQQSFLIALFVLIGGTDSLAGPLLGAFLLSYLPEAFHSLTQYRLVVYGLFLLIVMIFSPRGLVTRQRVWTASRRLRAAAARWASRREPAPSHAKPAPEAHLGTQPYPVEDGRRPGLPWAPGAAAEAPSPLSPVMILAGIGMRFAGVVALDDVSLEAYPGEVLGLIGPNGAGKTTLVNVATGLLRPTTGTVVLKGEEITDLPAHRRSRRGMARTFQAVRLFSNLTVEENVAVAASHADSEWDDLLERLALSADRDRMPGQLSYGHQRKVQIAQALGSAPAVLFMDEPSIGMNPAELAELTDLIGWTRDGGAGVVLVDHNLDLVMGLADRIVVLDFGRKIAEGTPEKIMSDPTVQAAYLGMPAGQESAP